MTRVVMTGFMAHHASESANMRINRFPGLLRGGLGQAGVEVSMVVPRVGKIDELLATGDHFIIGVSALSSVSANYAYGSLLLLSRLWDSGRVTIVLDTDKPRYVRTAFTGVAQDRGSLFKDFYRQRPDYTTFHASPELARELHDAIDHLLNDPWPHVVAPGLPWYTSPYEDAVLDVTNGVMPEGVMVDALSIRESPRSPAPSTRRTRAWLTEDTKNNWVRTVRKTLQSRVDSVTIDGLHDEHVGRALSTRLGLLVGLDTGRIRWTNRIQQALSFGVPVCSEWRDTQVLGESWTMLPIAIEAMSFSEVNEIATWQHEQYRNALPTPDQVVQQLHDLVMHDERTAA